VSRARLAVTVALAPVLLLAACGSGGGGAGRDAGAADAVNPLAAYCARYATDGGPVPFATVQRIFDDNCSACHVQGADLDLSDGVAWPNLVNHPAPASEACGGILVVPGNPSASYLYQKLTNPMPCAGTQMPRGDFGGTPLPTCVTDVVGAWISEGAPGPAGVPSDAGAAADGAAPDGG
jgi:hypothetical protein